MSDETNSQISSSTSSTGQPAKPAAKPATKPKSVEPSSTAPNTERRQRSGGIADGGRRKVDRAVVQPMNKTARIWFGLSLALTILIMIWTFSVPFQTEKPIFAWDKSDLPARPVNISAEILADPEHLMSDDQYRDYIWEIERDLQDQLEIRNRIPENLPDAVHAKKAGERKIASMKSELESLEEMERKLEDELDKDSARYQAMENLRKKLAESDEYLPRA